MATKRDSRSGEKRARIKPGLAANTFPEVRLGIQIATALLDAEAYRRLLVASVMEGRPAGEIVSRLIEAHLRRWSMPGDLSARARSSDRQAGEDRVIESMPAAA